MKSTAFWMLASVAIAGAPDAGAAQPGFKDCAECPEMLVLPEGSLPTPASHASATAGPVTIKSFAIGKFEVTQAEWFAMLGERPSEYLGDDLPVETVSWRDVQIFIQRLNARTGRAYRLPTEAEWEYAARAGSTTQYYFGDDPADLGQHAWFIDNAGETTHPVGQKLPNRFGLHDIHGNVWEWTQDCTQDHGQRKGNDETVARFIRDCHRSYRGGSMANKAPSLRLTYSQSGGIGDRYFGLGLRVARDVP
jgi:formylglycine-generating enzyme required for sulfatase activity